MVTSKVIDPVRELEPVDNAIAKDIEEAVARAKQTANTRETPKARLYYTMPFVGVRYYSFNGTGAS